VSNQTIRVLELLKRFNNGQKVCIEELKNDILWEEKSEKTIRRDLDIIKQAFPNSFHLIHGEKGCYRAITKSIFQEFLSERNLSLLIYTFNIIQQNSLFDSFKIDDNIKSIIENQIGKYKKVYEFKTKPFESKRISYELIKELEHSIYHQKYITIKYTTKDRIKEYRVKPYKIVFMNENFYLACEVEASNFLFSLYRISKIVDIIKSSKMFYQNLEIKDFIEFMQTPFAKYRVGFRKYLIEVILEVDRDKAFYFKSKKFLSSQKIIKTKKNGNLILSYQITQYMEIEELIYRWIPHIKVISPIPLKNRVLNTLKGYLK